MEKLRNIVNLNSPYIGRSKGNSIGSTEKFLTTHDTLRGHKLIVPVSEQIKQFIKEEFSKIKK